MINLKNLEWKLSLLHFTKAKLLVRRCLHRDTVFLFLSQPAQAWFQVFLYPLLPFWSCKLRIYSSPGQVYIKSLLFSPSWALSESIFHCWIVNGKGFLLLRFQRQVLSFNIYTECQFLRSTPNDRGIISTLWMLQDIVLITRHWQLQGSRFEVIRAKDDEHPILSAR